MLFNYLTTCKGTGIKPMWLWETKDFFDEFESQEINSDYNGVTETDTQYEITLELPGFKKEDIKIKIINGDLEITGKREKPTTFNLKKVYALPNTIDKDSITANLTNGILSIILKKKEVKQVEIPIN